MTKWGTIRWRGEYVHVSRALAGEPVALIETETGDWTVRYFDLDLGRLHRKTLTVTSFERRRGKPRRRRLHHARGVDLMDNAAALPTTPQPPQPPQSP